MPTLTRSNARLTVSIVVLFLFTPLLGVAQNPIPNPGFEDWTVMLPDSWTATATIPGTGPILQSDQANSGMFAVRGEAIALGDGVLPPLLVSGDDLLNPGIPVSERHESFTGFLQFFPLNSDSLSIEVLMNVGIATVGSGQIAITDSIDAYQAFSVPITYTTSDVPDRALITFLAIGRNNAEATAGTYYLVDDVAFDATSTSVEGEEFINTVSLEPNYPNPFAGVTHFTVQVNSPEHVSLDIYDVLGKKVDTVVNTLLNTGKHQLSWDSEDNPNGVYFYRLQAGGTIQTRQMTVLR